MYTFLLVCRHLRLLQTGYLCIVIELRPNTEALQGTDITINVENKEICKSDLSKAIRKETVISRNVCWILSCLFFFLKKADFMFYDNLILLICHPFLIRSMASCGTAQASLHNPQHRTRISNSVQLLWRNQHFCGNSRADTMD